MRCRPRTSTTISPARRSKWSPSPRSRDLDQHTAQVTAAKRNRIAWWIAAGAAVAALGFAATRMLMPNPNEALIADLPVIQQFDVLSQIENVEFLRTLAQQVPFEKLAPDPVSIDREFTTWKTVSESSPADRRLFLENLSPQEKASLVERVNRFNELEEQPEKQQQLQQMRELERTIRQADDGEQLQRTLLAYGSWLADRQPGEHEDLRVLPAADRIALIQRLRAARTKCRRCAICRMRTPRNFVTRSLPPTRGEKTTLNARCAGQRETFACALEGPPWLKAWLVILWELRWNDDKDDEREGELIATLSTEQQEYWRTLPERSRSGNSRRAQLMQWVRESIRPRWGPEELEKFFTDPDKLDSNQRERLLTLPRDQFQTQLERLYLAHTLGVENADEWLGDFGAAPASRRVRLLALVAPDDRAKDVHAIEIVVTASEATPIENVPMAGATVVANRPTKMRKGRRRRIVQCRHNQMVRRR